MEPGIRFRRVLWSAVVFLALIGAAVAVRRIVYLGPILTRAYSPPAVPPDSRAAQFAALDEVFARHPILTMIHVVPGLLFTVLGPFQFSEFIRARHLQWHRWNGRIFLATGFIIGISALFMSFTMQSIGGVNQAAATVLFGSFFLFALSKSFWHIRRREVALHRQWMIRAFAIGLAVASSDRGNFLRHQPIFRPDAGAIFRHRLLDRICSTPHRRGSLDSRHTSANHKSADDCLIADLFPNCTDGVS